MEGILFIIAVVVVFLFVRLAWLESKIRNKTNQTDRQLKRINTQLSQLLIYQQKTFYRLSRLERQIKNHDKRLKQIENTIKIF